MRSIDPPFAAVPAGAAFDARRPPDSTGFGAPAGGGDAQARSPSVRKRPRPIGDRPRSWRRHGPALVAVAAVASIVAGWMYRHEGHLTPEMGLGYWLGIIGAGAMLALLIYPVRKRVPSLRWLGSIRGWFRIHMLLGIVGPLLILYHCNFSFNSINGTVALMTMLVVAVSGVAGRFLYGKIHVGLDGRKAAVAEILADADALRHVIGEELWTSDRMMGRLDVVRQRILAPTPGLLRAAWSLLSLGALIRRCRRELMTDARAIIRQEAARRGHGWLKRRSAESAVGKHLDLYFSALRKAATFALFERLFALWHILHMPLFVLLVLAVIAHVIAVHLY